MRFGRFRLLHLSDFHFQEPGSGQTLAASIKRSLNDFRTESAWADGSELATEIAAVVLSGDFRQQRLSLAEGVDWKKETSEFIDGLMLALRWDSSQRDRILMVPGNHDATRVPVLAPEQYAPIIRRQVEALLDLPGPRPELGAITAALRNVADAVGRTEAMRPKHFNPDWSDYNTFVRSFYESNSRMKEVRTGPAKSDASAFVANRLADLGVCFVLLNAYAGAATFPDESNDEHRRVQLPGAVGQRQMDLIEGVLTDLGFAREEHHTVAVLHHHLFPMRRVDGLQDLSRRDILTDLPDLADWMRKWKTACVLHGHRHRPFFGVLRVVGISDSVNLDALGEQSDDSAFDQDYELVSCGVGQALNDEERCDVEGTDRILLPSLQLIDVTPDPHRFFEARIVVFPFQRDRNRWRSISKASVPRVYASELVLPEVQRQLFETECFAGDEVSLRTHYPLLPSTVAPQYVNWFVTSLIEADSSEGPVFAPARREAVFRRLISNIQAANKDKSLYSVLPFQLAGIYDFTAMFFTHKDVLSQALAEFQEPQWHRLLLEEPNPDGLRPEWLTNHLESANYRIGAMVREHWQRAGSKRSSTGVMRIVDLGAGVGRTIRRIVAALDDVLGEPSGSVVKVAYRGIELGPALADEADAHLRTRFTRRHRLQPLDESSDGRLVVAGEACATLLPESAASWFRDVDCVVASYCLHHIPSNFRNWQMVSDGSLFDILHPKLFADGDADAPITLKDAVEAGAVFGDVPSRRKLEFLEYLYEVFAWWRARRFGREHISLEDQRDACLLANRLFEFLPNRQLDLYKTIYGGLASGGLLIVADPNGFSSTFNRVNIFSDWRMAVAHFAEWTLVARWLHSVGFRDIEVIRQMRRKNLGVVEVDVPREWISRICANEPVDYRAMFGGPMKFEGLEIDDQHLGYIVRAIKP